MNKTKILELFKEFEDEKEMNRLKSLPEQPVWKEENLLENLKSLSYQINFETGVNKYFTRKGNRIRKSVDGHHMLVSKKPIPKEGKYTFSLKVIKFQRTYYNYFGIVNEKNYLSEYDYKNEAITYRASDGKLFYNNNFLPGGAVIDDGDIMHVVVDWEKKIISWYKGDAFLAQVELSEKFL